MPVLRKFLNGPHGSVEVDRPEGMILHRLSAEGERFLANVLSLKDGDEIRPKDLAFLIERDWAVAIPPEPEEAPAPAEPEPRPAATPPASRKGEPNRGGATRRTRGREIALQVLYQMEQNPSAIPAEIDRFMARRLKDERLQAFAKGLVAGVREHQAKIDEMISGVAENWRIDRMAAIDRNILRLGAFEMLHCPDVPTKVAINEALELAKRYSTAQSSRFVNGILDRLQNVDAPPTAELTPPEGQG